MNKTFLTVFIGMAVGAVIGAIASFKVAEKKADEKATEALAEERKAMREAQTFCDQVEVSSEEVDISDFTETDGNPFDISQEVKDCYDGVSEPYRPSSKPYILESMDDEWEEQHPYLKNFDEIEIVWDRKRGRAADEDGQELHDIKGCLGFNNLRSLKDQKVHIICERDGMVFITHLGDLYEYLDPEEDDRYEED